MMYVEDVFFFFFFKQKTAYEMRISDWSSDVCSSDLLGDRQRADRGEDVAFEAADDIGGVDLGPLRLGIFVPFAGDALERLPPCLNVFLNPELLRHVWIPAFAENRIGLVALVARIGQRDERIGAEGHALLLAVVIVVPTP